LLSVGEQIWLIIMMHADCSEWSRYLELTSLPCQLSRYVIVYAHDAYPHAEKQPLLQTSDCHSGPAYHSPSAQAAATSGAGNEQPRSKKIPVPTTLDAADRPRETPQDVNQFEHPAQPPPLAQNYGAFGGSIQVGAHNQELQVCLMFIASIFYIPHGFSYKVTIFCNAWKFLLH